jgi:hypothetical protein
MHHESHDRLTSDHRTNRGPRYERGGERLAQGLGWFSIALGTFELVSPRTVTRSLGMHGQETLVRAYGLREIAKGVGILMARDPAPWLWARVAGDALDLGTLATAYTDDNPRRDNVGLALLNVAGVTAVDVYCAQQLSRENRQRTAQRPIRDYSGRSGFPRPAHEMRGVARDAVIPPDMQTPAALRPSITH